MTLKKKQIILWSLQEIRDNESQISRKGLSNALGIKIETLQKYLSILAKKGLIYNMKTDFTYDNSVNFALTAEGKKELRYIDNTLNKLILSPDRHNIDHIIYLKDILNRSNYILDKICLLSIYFKKRNFEIIPLIRTLGFLSNQSPLYDIFNNQNNQNILRFSFIEYYYLLDFNCISNPECLQDLKDDITDNLLLADIMRKNGKIKESLQILENIENNNEIFSPHQWFFLNIFKSFSHQKNGKIEEALKLLKNVEKESENNLYQALSVQYQADLLSQIERFNDSLELFKSCINCFSKTGYSVLLALSYNNRGVAFYHMEKYEHAEKDWEKALKIIRNDPNTNLLGLILINLSSVYSLKKKFSKSYKFLLRAEKIINGFNDYENKSLIEFNKALFNLRLHDYKKAKLHYIKSKEISYPLPSPTELLEREKVIIKEMMRLGIERGNII